MKRRWRAGLTVVGGIAAIALAVSFLGNSEADRRQSELEAMRSLAPTRHGEIEYVSWGQGPPVLVIHGAGGGFDQGRLLAEAVGGEGSRFIAVSRFGYLGSAMPAEPSTKAQAEALFDLLDQLGIEQASILAMSGGVPPALKFAEMFPERTDRLVLLSSAPFTPFSPDVEDRPIPTWAYSTLLGNDAIYWALTHVAPGQLRSAFDARPELLKASSQEEQAFVDRLVEGFLPASARLPGVGNEGAAVDPTAAYNLEAIRALTLVVHSRDDSLNPFAIAEALQRQIRGACLIAYDSGGHLLLGHHEELQERVAQFLQADETTGNTVIQPASQAPACGEPSLEG